MFTIESETAPKYVKHSTLLRGDTSSSLTWVNKCRGGKEPGAGALLRILGFGVLHGKGADNITAGDISRWAPELIDARLCASLPNVAWRK